MGQGDIHAEVLDVVVIGGAAAGLAAAVQLGRSRRSVLVVDAGQPRNAPASHMHGYLGHDGRPPGDFLAVGRQEAARYGVRIVEGSVTAIERREDGLRFAVVCDDGTSFVGRRVLVATGLVDELPDIPGVAEEWGRGVIHCPYCHGWEVRDREIVVIATGPLSTHQALLFRQLSEQITVVDQEANVISSNDRLRLVARGVRIARGPVVEVLSEGGHVTGVRLVDGRLLDAAAVVVAPRFVARTGPLRALGLEPAPDPMGTGEMIETDARGATAVHGVYAAGNVANVSHQVLHAAADGSRVAAVVNADLADEDASLALAALLERDAAETWDQRYAATNRWWSGAPNGSLVAETAHLRPGTALDVGCGEGADAVWLAQQGWQVTAVDISSAAIDRARQAAAEAGVDVRWRTADIVADPLPERFDLVTAHYPALRHTRDDAAIRTIVDAVADGGTLLVVGHAFDAVGHAHRGFDPSAYVQPPDVARLLDDTWVVEINETRPRTPPPGHTGPDVPDVVLRARRTRTPRRIRA